MSEDIQKWFDRVDQWKSMTRDVPRAIREDIVKARQIPKDPIRAPKSVFNDPLAIQYSLGYKDRKYSVTYDVLKRIPQQLSIVSSILQTRCNQVAAFCQPYRNTKSVGYMIKHKDPSHEPTEAEMEFVKKLETFIYHCGSAKPNPYAKHQRDDFESFLKKIVRDSLVFDQACFEVVPDRRGLPYEFIAVDASTIRIAADEDDIKTDAPLNMQRTVASMAGSTAPYRLLEMFTNETVKDPRYIQLVNGQIENIYTDDELAFGVRNPRTDIYVQGYGYGELEQLITIITAHLHAEEYNRRFFMQGSAPKGILNFKGDNITPEQLEVFQRQWRENLEGVHNAWRTPILQSEQGIDWVELHRTNQEMEYGQWIEYLVKITCGVFLIDPAEINFDLHGGVQQTPLFESSQEWKLKASRDKGLKPLLRFLAKLINKHVIEPLDDHFVFDFVGLDELTEQEKHELRKEEVGSYKTLNEVRLAEDLPAVDDGDIVLNPTYLQARQMKMQEDQMKQMQEQQQAAAAAPQQGQAPAPDAQGQPQDPAQQQQAMQQQEHQASVPQYADNFQKGLSIRSGEKFIEIDLDGWIDLRRKMS